VPSNSTEVRGAPGSSGAVPITGSVDTLIAAPMVSVGLGGGAQPSNESLAVIANLCFSGEGDFPLCLLFEPLD